jgi:hypothetical protein
MSQTKQLRFAVDNQRTYIGVQVVTDGTVTETVALDAKAIDQLIIQLASLRIQLREPVASEPTEANLKMIVNDPKVALRIEALDDKQVLFLRHPGLGWLGFALSEDTTESIADWIDAHLKGRKAI